MPHACSKKGILTALMAAVLLIVSSPALSGDTDEVDRFIQAEMQRQHIPGASVAVLRDGKVVKLRGYGLADIENEVPATADTIFQSGSVGKQFTAAAAMLLVEDGKLKLDESVATYLPSAPAHWQPITIRHLLTHTSGLASYPEGFDFRRDYNEDELLSMAVSIPLAFAPGEQWRYSNVGYLVLGVIIGKVTGRFYGDFLTERIFKPAGMATARIISEDDIVPRRASGYRKTEHGLRNQSWVSPSLNTTADGSLYVSARDLARWDAALAGKTLFSQQSRESIWSPVRLGSGQDWPYGFGWQLGKTGNHNWAEHGGQWQGFSSHIVRFQEGLTVVVLANLAKVDARQIAHGIAGLYDSSLAPRKTVPLDESIAREYVGKYELRSDLTLTVYVESGKLWASATGQPSKQLLPVSPTEFVADGMDATIRFVRNPNGQVTHLVLSQGGEHVGKKVE